MHAVLAVLWLVAGIQILRKKSLKPAYLALIVSASFALLFNIFGEVNGLSFVGTLCWSIGWIAYFARSKRIAAKFAAA